MVGTGEVGDGGPFGVEGSARVGGGGAFFLITDPDRPFVVVDEGVAGEGASLLVPMMLFCCTAGLARTLTTPFIILLLPATPCFQAK